MKVLNIHATLEFNKELLKKIKIKEKFLVVTTIQYLKEVKKYFPKAKQILGCSKLKAANYLYIGTGKFHPLRLIKYSKNIYTLNPETKQFKKITSQEIQTHKKQQKGKLIKFYSAKNYGIIVSTKPGQYKLKQAIKLKNKLKNSYLFITDNINKTELENFPQIDCWINTACPRIDYKNIINLEDVPLKI